jgi:NDP-sugar pyrophosphorylase family protein
VRTSACIEIRAGKIRGRRLEELTRDTPKPLLKVGPRPILDTVVDAFAAQGFRHIWRSVHYRGEQTEAHFGDRSDRGLEIRYLREDRTLGTCGSPVLLRDQAHGPIVVANGDVMTQIDFGQVVDGHIADGAAATVVVRDYEMQVPFGLIDADGGRVVAIQEKTGRVFKINAGVYVLSRAALDLIPPGRAFDMPDLLQALIDGEAGVRPHRAEGYWVDVGRLADFDRANADFTTIFDS